MSFGPSFWVSGDFPAVKSRVPCVHTLRAHGFRHSAMFHPFWGFGMDSNQTSVVTLVQLRVQTKAKTVACVSPSWVWQWLTPGTAVAWPPRCLHSWRRCARVPRLVCHSAKVSLSCTPRRSCDTVNTCSCEPSCAAGCALRGLRCAGTDDHARERCCLSLLPCAYLPVDRACS